MSDCSFAAGQHELGLDGRERETGLFFPSDEFIEATVIAECFVQTAGHFCKLKS